MNTELLQKVKQQILAEPERFAMAQWTCGTTHCIGGWATALSGYVFGKPNCIGIVTTVVQGDGSALYCGDVAAEVLGLDETQADNLFHHDNWPPDLRDDYGCAKTQADQAQIAAERIDRFILADGYDGRADPDDDNWHDDFDDADWDDEDWNDDI